MTNRQNKLLSTILASIKKFMNPEFLSKDLFNHSTLVSALLEIFVLTVDDCTRVRYICCFHWCSNNRKLFGIFAISQRRKTKIPELCNKKLIKHNLVLSPGDERDPQKAALRENRCGFYPYIVYIPKGTAELA